MNQLLHISNLNVNYGNKKVIDDIDLLVEKRQLCGVLGLNGSGKTTILNAIDGLIDYSGKIICCNKDVKKLNEYDRAKLISYIRQRTTLKDGISPTEFVLYGLNPFLKFYEFPTEKQKERAEEILIKLGLQDKLNSDFGSLSEGQKQLVVLARSVMQNAPVMLMDEPDSSLDYNNKHVLYLTVQKAIKEYNFGGLITVHDPTFALKYCDKIFVLHNGKIVKEIYKSITTKEEVENSLRLLYGNISVIEHNNEYVIVVNNEN